MMGPWSQLTVWLLVLLPATTGVTLCVLRPRGRVAVSSVSVIVAAVTVLLAVITAVGRPSVAVRFLMDGRFGLAVDPLAAIVLVTVASVSLLVLAFAAADVRRAAARFHGLMLLFVAAVMVTVAATTLPTLLAAWEIMGATSYALIGFAWRDRGKVPAGTVAFLTTRAADLGLYVAAGAALAAGHGMALADLPDAPAPVRTVIAVGIVTAALGKAAQLPFAFWLSSAMEGPSPVSALLHSAAMVAMGGFLLLRVQGLLAVSGWVGTATAWVGALTALLLGVVAVAQRDLKQLLAASTSAQLGFVVLAAGVGGVTAGTTQLVAHAATKALLFLVAGAWLSALGTKQLAGLRGVARRWPGVGIVATIGLLALAGVAPLSLWLIKEAVLAVARASSVGLYVVGLAASVISAGYAGKVLAVIWQRPEASADSAALFDTEETGSRRIRPLMRPPLAVLALAAAVLGVLVVPPIGSELRAALSDNSGRPGMLELVGSAVAALLVVAAAWRWRLPAPGWARSWLGLTAAVRVVVLFPVDRLSRGLAWFDDQVIDRGVEATARTGWGMARRLAQFDDRGVDAGVAGLARAVRRFGRAATRPQTGQLYQYYLQSAVVLAAAFLLLLLVR